MTISVANYMNFLHFNSAVYLQRSAAAMFCDDSLNFHFGLVTVSFTGIENAGTVAQRCDS